MELIRFFSIGEVFVQMPLKQQSYGDWKFEVRDPNGYVLVFGGGS